MSFGLSLSLSLSLEYISLSCSRPGRKWCLYGSADMTLRREKPVQGKNSTKRKRCK